MRKRTLILIEWDDISAYDNWRDETDSPNWKPLRCISVGWRLKSGDRKNLTIASTRAESGQCTDRQVIPRGCVVKIRKLE